MRNENYDDSKFSKDRYDQNRDNYLNQNRRNERRSYDDLYDQERSYLQGERPYSSDYNFKHHGLNENNRSGDRYPEQYGNDYQNDLRKSYRGIGPKSYKRTDERVCEDICEKLMDSPYINAENVEVKVDKGNVTLSGTVDSRRVKYFVEDIVDSTSGVNKVINHIEIDRSFEIRGNSHNHYQNE